MAFSTSSTVNGKSRIYSSFSIETGVSASILAFSSTRSGLPEASDRARFEKWSAHAFRDMVGQWWQYHQLWVWSSFSCYSLVVWSDMGVRRRIFYLCEGDVCFQLERHNSQLFNSSSQSTFFIIKWSSFGHPFSFQVCRAALLWAQSAERVALFHLQGFLQHFSGSDLAAASLSVSERWEIAASMSSNPSRQAWEFSSDSCCFTSRGSHWFLLI